MTIWLVKLVHVAAIAVWVGGLVALPSLLAGRTGLQDAPLERLHRAARFLHIALVSPAAYVAIASGTVLVFLRETWTVWFAVKLVLVGLLVVLHVGMGLALLSTFQPEGRHRRLIGAGLRAAAVAAGVGILWAVLAKPEIDVAAVAGEAFEPGALGRWFDATVAPLIDGATP
jgi:protoporphyrinogen IX oxidase